jgi:glycosyltransferase involved in cell wall biosynthesis
MQALCGVSDLVFAAIPRQIDCADNWPLAVRFVEPPHYFQRGRSLSQTPSSISLRRIFGELAEVWPRRVQADQAESLWKYLDGLDMSRFDAAHVESLSMIPYGVALKTRWPHLRVTLNIDNIDAVYAWQGLRAARPWWVSREWYWGVRNVMRLSRFARRWLPAFDAVWVCSETDRQWVLCRTLQRAVHVVPNGMDCTAYAGIDPTPDRPRVVMAGTMMEGPNSDGAVWFAKKVWPRIKKLIPDAEFWCVGRDPCPTVRALDVVAGVTITGSVPDVRPYLARSGVAVVPIRYGTGTRLKILEAMAAGLPVVSTRVGADGLDFEPGRDLLLADTPRAFAWACVELLRNESRRREIAAAGRGAVQKYDWPSIYQMIQDLATRRDKQVDLPIRADGIA